MIVWVPIRVVSEICVVSQRWFTGQTRPLEHTWPTGAGATARKQEKKDHETRRVLKFVLLGGCSLKSSAKPSERTHCSQNGESTTIQETIVKAPSA